MAKKKSVAKSVPSPATAEVIKIPPVRMAVVRIPIKNLDGPLVVHNWSEKAIREMIEKQMGITVAGKTPKDPDQEYRASLYTADDGTLGFPASAFKDAMVRAAKGIQGLDMITVRQLFFMVPDCIEDRVFNLVLKDGTEYEHRIRTQLVRIIGEPQMRMDMVRLGGRTADIRFRGEFAEWEAILTLRYVADRILPEVLANLVNLAGQTVGIGEGRPEKSTDMGWGRYQVDFDRPLAA